MIPDPPQQPLPDDHSDDEHRADLPERAYLHADSPAELTLHDEAALDGTLEDGEPRSAKVNEEKKSKQTSLHFAVATSCLMALILALLLRAFVAQAYEIRGKSMEPTLRDGEKVMISKLSPTLQSVERGDLIIFSSPSDPKKDLIKRVIAVSGDTIEIDDGTVIVNGRVLEESYANHDLFPRPITAKNVTSPVPGNMVIVLGDNRPNSQDSRHFGPVSLDGIKGKVFLRWWPISSVKTFP